MKTLMRIRWCLAIALTISAGGAYGQDDNQPSPFLDGFYVLPSLSYTQPDNERLLDDGIGYDLGVGYRFNRTFAVELDGSFSDLDREVGGSTDMAGLTLRGLGYLTDMLPNAFLSFGAGQLQTDAQGASGSEYKGLHFEFGVGYVQPLHIGRYDFGVRADARIRHNNGQDDDDADEFSKEGLVDNIFRIGLHLPIGLRPLPPEPEPKPLAVVEPVKACADGVDNDGDGVQDYPGDKGCDSPEDDDETGPPQCSDGIDNDGDALVDHPQDTGCQSPADNDELNECRTPKPGQRLSLNGCGPGDVILLRGVNFEFDKAVLTANAKTILDAVAAELLVYPAVTVELGGHTDARGSESYNQQLSEARAAAVRKYLEGKGVDAGRMTSVGYGESQPIAGNSSDEGREQNRRTELTVTG